MGDKTAQQRLEAVYIELGILAGRAGADADRLVVQQRYQCGDRLLDIRVQWNTSGNHVIEYVRDTFIKCETSIAHLV